LHVCLARNYWSEFSMEFVELLRKKTLKDIMDDTHYECLTI